MNQQSRRIAIAGLLPAVAVAFAALGGVGLANGSIGAAQDQYGPGKKATICHKAKNTITVSENALKAHLAHGDKLGACQNGHRKNRGKHTGEAKHAPNPATGSVSQDSVDDDHGDGPGNGKGNGKGKGKGK